MKFSIHKNCALGFTLIETIIAIGLFMFVIVGILSISGNVLILSRGQGQTITAQYLLQEGVEYVRNNRDSVLNSGSSWSDFVNPNSCTPIGSASVPSLCYCIYNGGVQGACSVDPLFNTVTSCDPINGCTVTMVKSKNTSNKTIYCDSGVSDCLLYGTGTPTSFTRTIRLKQNTSNLDEMFVDVTVKWTDTFGMTQSKNIKTSLFNW